MADVLQPSKCVVLRIAPKNKKILQSEYKLHGHILETEEASSFLGVTITDNLTWDKHIQNITNKGNRTLGFIRRNLRDCTVPVKAATYTAMVRPSLAYASTVWDTPNQAHIKYSAELPDTYIMTTTAEHQDASPRWWKTSTGNRSQPEERQIGFQRCILRPVKSDWAVLSKDTAMDISISKSERQCVFIHL